MNGSKLIPNNATKNSGYYCKYFEPESDLVLKAKFSVRILLITLGLAGNIFVIVLAVKYTPRKNLHHLIINMAVSDALLPLMVFIKLINWSSQVKLLTYPDGILGDILCKVYRFAFQVSYRASLLTLLIISIERFRITRKTLQKSLPYTLRQRVLIVGVCWLIPMVMNVHILYHSTVISGGICYYVLANFSGYFNLVLSIFSPIVMVMIFVFSILTIKRLSRTQDIHAHLNQEQQKARIRRTRAAVHMVLASLLVYTCCCGPARIYYFVRLISAFLGFADRIFLVCMDWRSLKFIIYDVLLLLNSCFSPCIYIIFLSDFREAAKKVLCRKTNQRENRRNSIELQEIINNPHIEPEQRRRRRRNSNDEDDQEV